MSYQAIYRKYRPKIFDDVLGQEHVTRTLKNQIVTNNIAHAYLFSGIRGTGKTSTAKIFSRAVNCINSHDGNPCNECDICKSTLDENNMDVIEMDAASNNGVDDIRELRDKVMFLPVQSKYKVYIIDEVHMLSKGAYNALLKTLEEPPEHLVFILATTEPHKVPATIISRCQRFDLKRINSSDIVENMQKICMDENIEYEDKALKLIASNSEGAMRDALSILDKCVSFNDKKVDYDTVVDLLGTVNFQVVIDVAKEIIEKNIEQTITLVDEILDSGKEIEYFLDEIIICFRNMLMIKSTKSTENLIGISEDEAVALKELSKNISIEEIVHIIEELSLVQLECKRALNPKVMLETRLIKLLKYSDSISALIKRVEQLENALYANNLQTLSQTNKEVNKQQTKEKTEPKEIKKSAEDNSLKSSIAPTKKEFIDNNNIETPNQTQAPTEKQTSQPSLSDNDIYNQIINGWDEILKKIRSDNVGLQAIIRESKLVNVENKKAYFEFEPKFTFHISAANLPKNRLKLEEVISNFTKQQITLEFNVKKEEKQHLKKKTKTMEDVYEDFKNEFGEEVVEFNQED